MSRVLTDRRSLLALLTAAVVAGFIIFVLPQINGLGSTLRRLRRADPAWSIAAVLFEVTSLAGYITLFRTVFSCPDAQIGWRESYEINMAGTVASKLLAAAGAGGVALTIWALRASGLKAAAIARRMLAFELLLYGVFTSAIVVCGVGLRTGAFPGEAPWTLTVVPAIIAGTIIATGVVLGVLPQSLTARLGNVGVSDPPSNRRLRRLLGRIRRTLVAAPHMLHQGIAVAADLVRSRRIGVLGAVAYWGFDIATLWAALHAFGTPPPFAAVVLAYFIGQLGNALPIPGGIGGVEGGMIGALIAFGAPASLALLGVLGYRLISFWLPTLPGAHAYLRLRRTVARWQRTESPDEQPLTARGARAAAHALPTR